MFWEYMERGFAHGGYVLGLAGTLIIAGCLIALFIAIMGLAFGKDDEEDERRERHVRKNQQL